MTIDVEWIKDKARTLDRIPYFEDFHPGQIIGHRWGRTLTESDNIAFTTQTMTYNPLYFNREYAQAKGHADLVVNPLLISLTTIGLSVQDLSESGGAFLGIKELVYHRPVLVGETLTARSEVLDARTSDSRPGMGIVSWRTEGLIHGEAVISFVRTNLIYRRPEGA